MSEMVERVARAMCNQYLKRLHDNETRREAVVEYEWHEWEGEAIAVIKAMRDPTARMTEAGLAAAWNEINADIGTVEIQTAIGRTVWHYMIDAAIGEQP